MKTLKQISLLCLFWMIGMGAWAYDFTVNGIYYNYLDETAKTCAVTSGTTKYTGSVTIPSTVTYNSVDYTVTQIGHMAFYECEDLTSVTMPNTVTDISGYSFMKCTGLSSVTIPNSVYSIGQNAFYGCTGFTYVQIPNSAKYIRNYAFYGCIYEA